MTVPSPALRWCAAAGVAATLACVSAAGAATTSRYTARTLNQPASSGLKVSGPLSAFRATSSARVVVPAGWTPTGGAAGQARFRVRQNGSCSYDLTYTATTALGATGDAAARVAAALPAPGAHYLLDSGARGNRAFRVIRRKTADGRIRLQALWAGVLTKRADIAPAGQAAWTQVRVTATSRKGDECHAGTYRDALGPNIGDSLAVARTKLRFVRAG
jgi:hypothetical protein